MKAALVIGDPGRLESIGRFFGPNGVPLPMPPQEVVDAVVRVPCIHAFLSACRRYMPRVPEA